MGAVEKTLQELDGGRVLDVATYQGRFAQVLVDNLRSYEGIVGIDVSEQAIEAARAAVVADRVSFEVMDAEALAFEDESFDTVVISASLHHLADIGRVLGEMKRVLKPGGRFIVVEMHRGARSEPERTSIELHQWAAEVDSAMGRLHNRTLTRDRILRHVMGLGLQNVEHRDCFDADSDPMEREKLEKLEEMIGVVAERAAALPEGAELSGRADELIRRVREVGAQGEPVLVVTGEKRG